LMNNQFGIVEMSKSPKRDWISMQFCQPDLWLYYQTSVKTASSLEDMME
jgi:hypothetical protein